MNTVRHVEELLMLNGTKFIDSAYRTFLKRSADRAGREHFLERLRLGHSKDAVLLAIADSAEARAVSAPIEGLEEVRRRSATQRGFTLFGFREWSREIESRLNRLEFTLGEAQNGLADRLGQLETNVDQLRSRVADVSSAASSGRLRPAGAKADAPQSIKRGLKLETKGNAAEFIGSLQQQLQNTAEAQTLSIR